MGITVCAIILHGIAMAKYTVGQPCKERCPRTPVVFQSCTPLQVAQGLLDHMNSVLDCKQHQQRRSLQELLFLYGIDQQPDDKGVSAWNVIMSVSLSRTVTTCSSASMTQQYWRFVLMVSHIPQRSVFHCCVTCVRQLLWQEHNTTKQAGVQQTPSG